MAAEQGRQADLAVAVHLADLQAALEPAGKAIQVHLAVKQLPVMRPAAAEAQARQGLKDLKWSLPKAETAAAVKVLALVVRL